MSEGVRAAPEAFEPTVPSAGREGDARFARGVVAVLVSVQILWVGALILGVSWVVAAI